ncbi:hypothetical protein M8A51_25315 [Schlegelella sp. S2-27]|uniref:Uncharacterized protein n=1 Tax=Caldimonas mangrovi TaxID=2944811 RepID=A0ABT0YW99_9BURK|nr:hypothetical protein [Caldimonas mangrovi]MCM5682858.1 hypothetical protein [Caldimonas mangrovi]
MDRLARCAAYAAVFSTLALAACGGSSSSSGASSGGSETVQGISTPNSVSVVTPKNGN